MTVIPRRIHFIWIGPAPLPPYAAANIARCRALHPDWQVELWSEDRLDFDARFPKAAYVLRQWSRASNYFRAQLLERHGGIYLDTDMEVLRPLDPLLADPAFIGLQLREFGPSCVNGAIIGSRPGHWFVQRARQRLADEMTGAEPVDDSTGPGNVTAVLIERGLRAASAEKSYVEDMAVYPPPAFYPYHWSEPRPDDAVSPETFAIHRWTMTWVPKPGPIARNADWARRKVPFYWRIDRTLWRARRSGTLLRPFSAVLATRFDRLRRAGRVRAATPHGGQAGE